MLRYAVNIYASRDLMGVFGGGRAHKGFKEVYKKEWDTLYTSLYLYATSIRKNPRDFKYRISGYSMGGALATMTALRIATLIFGGTANLGDRLKVVTFGMPKALDSQAAAYYECLLGLNTVRTHIKNDWVPPLPRKIRGFYHVGIDLFLDYEFQGANPHLLYGMALFNNENPIAFEQGYNEFKAKYEEAINQQNARQTCPNRLLQQGFWRDRNPIELRVLNMDARTLAQGMETVKRRGFYFPELVAITRKLSNLKKKRHFLRNRRPLIRKNIRNHRRPIARKIRRSRRR